MERAHGGDQSERASAPQRIARERQFFTRANRLHAAGPSGKLLTGRRFDAAGEKIKP